MSQRQICSIPRRVCFVVAMALLVCAATGCVQRRMTVRSNPPGAMVYIDDYPIGTTPVSTSFIYYGTRKIRLVKDGYETLTVYQPVKTPWYQWFGVDFFTENLWPGEIRDERAYEYQMIPTIHVPNDQLIGRAEQLRANSQPLPGAVLNPAAAPPTEPIMAPGQIVAPGPIGQPLVAPPPSGAPVYLPPGNTPSDTPTFGAPPL